MDRQSLLEKKRQRLQELKQRRLGGSSGDVSQVDLLLEKLDEPKKNQVSVGIQVGTMEPIGKTEVQQQDTEKENVRYDKAIQATETRVETTVEPPRSLVKEAPQVEEVDEVEVNVAIYEAMKRLDVYESETAIDNPRGTHDIHDSKTPNISNDVPDSESKLYDDFPFKLVGVVSATTRPVSCIDVSPHFKDVVVVSFAPSDSSESPGLAVIYNFSTKEEYVLHSTSPIVQIRFDKVNSHKVIGGLVDGKVVIWDLEIKSLAPSKVPATHLSTKSLGSSKLPLLPLLSTPPFSTLSSSSIKSNTGITFDHHTLPITSIHQLRIDANDSIVSFSLDGVINLWSTNLLASPVADSIRLFLPVQSGEFTNFREAVRITNALVVDDKRNISLTSEDFKFLGNVIVSSQRGEIFHLSNVRKNGYINCTFNLKEELTNITTDIAFLPNDNKDVYFITSNLDWTLKVWSTEKPLNKDPLVIPTDCLVEKLASRPQHANQLVTLGLTNKSSRKSTLLQFWDLEYKLFGCIFEIPVEKDFVGTTIEFSEDGSKLLVGSSKGEILMFEIDDKMLVDRIQATEKIEMDEGFVKYLEGRVNEV